MRNNSAALRLLARKDLPLPEILAGLAVVYLLWVLVHMGAFRTEGADLASLNEERMYRLKTAVQSYRWANDSLPPGPGALACAAGSGKSCIPFAEPEILSDVWGAPYAYKASGKAFTLSCLGADKRPGGSGPDRDLTLKGSL
ncbi:MAG: type II secretion system protein GspG [Elusimicrobiota bacterium]|nr:type II secretion system protein GspG [Elusimicrobiota bacterium]